MLDDDDYWIQFGQRKKNVSECLASTGFFQWYFIDNGFEYIFIYL